MVRNSKFRGGKLLAVAALSITLIFVLISPVDACSRSGNSGGPNPDTGGALDGNYQFVKTDSNGTVLSVSYGTNTVGSAPSGGNVWSNNGAWGNVQVGGVIRNESSGNIYYPPGCSSTTTTTTTTTTIPKTSTTSTIPAVVDDGESEDDYADIGLRETGKKFDLRISSSFPETKMMLRAYKKGKKSITWSLTTNTNGNYRIITKRALKGFRLSLWIDGNKWDSLRAR